MVNKTVVPNSWCVTFPVTKEHTEAGARCRVNDNTCWIVFQIGKNPTCKSKYMFAWSLQHIHQLNPIHLWCHFLAFPFLSNSLEAPLLMFPKFMRQALTGILPATIAEDIESTKPFCHIEPNLWLFYKHSIYLCNLALS